MGTLLAFLKHTNDLFCLFKKIFFSSLLEFKVIILLMKYFFRCDNYNREHRSARDEKQWTSVRCKCPKGSKVLPNTSDGADGPTRWNLETIRQRRLCT